MLRFYILVNNYEQGLQLHDLLDGHDVENRIVPVPASVRDRVGCGMCLMVAPENAERARTCLNENHADYVDIVSLEGQLKGKRDRYC
ncbi:MAG: DUF3343 domain-containing protein [Lachnospiraceae bacterium]|nr:DUF3343 domain-containing protein [Lachnospiraceae bacterium]